MRILVIDNYDSFTYLLVQYLGQAGWEPVVYRNDAVTVDAALGIDPDAILVSPGPGTPADAGISLALVERAWGAVPLFGVCLGQQAIAEVAGGRTERGERLMHGKTSAIKHQGTGLFDGVGSPTTVMRYHSLVTPEDSIPDALKITARCVDPPHEVMSVADEESGVYGVQFHPESIGTPEGRLVIENFLEIAAGRG